MFQEDDKLGKSPANLFIPARAGGPSPRWQNACRRAGRMPFAARPADNVALRIQGVHDGGDSYPTMRDG
ncbi:hypothetical protein A6U98_25010 [Rhizobium sp. WYCCWR10014]|nr:hypothetical protein A6U98_25010 [Rhizobium sp. WYCCWR10014]